MEVKINKDTCGFLGKERIVKVENMFTYRDTNKKRELSDIIFENIMFLAESKFNFLIVYNEDKTKMYAYGEKTMLQSVLNFIEAANKDYKFIIEDRKIDSIIKDNLLKYQILYKK